jgi:uncharacterized protein
MVTVQGSPQWDYDASLVNVADRPAVRENRIIALDVLRGVAVGGILLANVFVFFGLLFDPDGHLRQLPTARIDRAVEFLEHVIVEGKFYSIFSLLFGIGFGLQLSRRGEVAIGRFRRRLAVLLGIGFVHAFLIWAGDILLLYALLGFSMPWFARRSDRSLLRWTAGLLAAPTVLYVAGLAAWMAFGPADSGQPAPSGPAEGIPPEILARLNAIGTGGFADALIGNLIFLVGRWADLLVTLRFPKVLGMFVLGLWVVRQGIAADPSSHRRLLEKWRRLGLGVGLPLNLAAAWALSVWPYLPPSPGALLGVACQAVGIPLLALGYASAIVLAVIDGRRTMAHFAPVGRMALTNYLMHSIACVTLSYGFGFGLWGRIGATQAWGIAVLVVAVQIPLSLWWLSGHRYGPMEWVWRRLTYGETLPMRASS